ncbi:MAG: adenosylcobinamide-GDP ribazoletransferase, partial [Candidatus Sulfobium sp.]
MKRLLTAFQFLTVIPVGAGIAADDADIAKSSALFVPVGLAQGILLVAADKALGVVFQPGLAIALVLLVLVLTNGGFHLDGLADTFDALASKSTGDASKDMEKKLSIMRDGTAGPIGVTTIVFSLGLKYLALVDISGFSSSACYFSLFLMPMMSKWTMVASMYLGRPARQDGLGRLFV